MEAVPGMDMTLAVQGLVNLFTNMDGKSRVMFIRLLVTKMKDDEVDVFLQVIQYRQKAESGDSMPTGPDVSKFLDIELKQEPIEHDADSYFESTSYKNLVKDEKMREQEVSGEGVIKAEKPKKAKGAAKVVKLGLPKEKKVYYCDKCDKKCHKKSDLTNHIETVHEGLSFPCLECDHKATRKWNLKAHVDLVHRGIVKVKKDYEKKFFCDKCSKKFSKMSDLLRHLEVHEGIRYYCEECDYSATKKWHLQQHVDATHKGIIYPCGQCNYEAKTKQTLQRHMQSIHDGVRYPCEYCGYQATQKHCLKKHIQLMHSGPEYAFDQHNSTAEETSRSETEDRGISGYSRSETEVRGQSEYSLSEIEDHGQSGYSRSEIEERGLSEYSRSEIEDSSQLRHSRPDQSFSPF